MSRAHEVLVHQYVVEIIDGFSWKLLQGTWRSNSSPFSAEYRWTRPQCCGRVFLMPHPKSWLPGRLTLPV